MRIILVRHGEADPDRSGIDSARQLTDLGHQQAAQTAQFILAHCRPDLLIVSPYIRAQQTAAYLQRSFAEQFGDLPTQVFDGITPDDDAAPAVQWLSQLSAECIVVVCHMNVIAYMAALLTEDAPENFALAEARIYEQPTIMLGLSNEITRFVPTQNAAD